MSNFLPPGYTEPETPDPDEVLEKPQINTGQPGSVPPPQISTIRYQRKKTSAGTWAFTIGIAAPTILMFLTCAGCLFFSDPERSERREVFLTAKQAVKNACKFPEEADFGLQNSGDNVISKNDDGSYDVAIWVIAKNAFGVRSKHTFIVEVRPVSGGWKAVPVALN